MTKRETRSHEKSLKLRPTHQKTHESAPASVGRIFRLFLATFAWKIIVFFACLTVWTLMLGYYWWLDFLSAIPLLIGGISLFLIALGLRDFVDSVFPDLDDSEIELKPSRAMRNNIVIGANLGVVACVVLYYSSWYDYVHLVALVATCLSLSVILSFSVIIVAIRRYPAFLRAEFTFCVAIMVATICALPLLATSIDLAQSTSKTTKTLEVLELSRGRTASIQLLFDDQHKERFQISDSEYAKLKRHVFVKVEISTGLLGLQHIESIGKID